MNVMSNSKLRGAEVKNDYFLHGRGREMYMNFKRQNHDREAVVWICYIYSVLARKNIFPLSFSCFFGLKSGNLHSFNLRFKKSKMS